MAGTRVWAQPTPQGDRAAPSNTDQRASVPTRWAQNPRVFPNPHPQLLDRPHVRPVDKERAAGTGGGITTCRGADQLDGRDLSSTPACCVALGRWLSFSVLQPFVPRTTGRGVWPGRCMGRMRRWLEMVRGCLGRLPKPSLRTVSDHRRLRLLPACRGP